MHENLAQKKDSLCINIERNININISIVAL